jgi:NAD(P)-dependent dehydrogenase (short-subunit alcohol dehydrogenase family)
VSKLFDLTGKVAIVTGGGGGIGRVLAVGLAEAGADVVVASRGLEKLQPVADKISAMGRKSMAVTMDITQEKSVANMVEQVVKKFGHIDILVNCAGLAIRQPPEKMPVDDWQKVMDFNARGVFISCQAVGRVMIKQGGGKIINISSVRGRYGAEGTIAYGTSKGAVDATTRLIAFEWAKYKVYVNAIAPTVVATELTKPVLNNVELAKTLLARIPLGRFEEPEDIVGPVIFLASKASDFVTGQVLYVDGGATIG